MSFSDKFNEYLSLLNVSYPQFARYSGMSASAVRRYKNGESEPVAESAQIKKLANGIYRMSVEKNLALDEDEILGELEGSLRDSVSIDYKSYVANLNALIKQLDIRVTVLAKALSFDPSHISKILSGQRRPGHISGFTQGVGSYIARICTDGQHTVDLAKLIGCDENQLDTPRAVSDAVTKWLSSNTELSQENPLGAFLDKLESFSLDEYINAIHFNDIKLPTTPFQLPTNKTYTTLDGMKKCELDFIKATVLSKSRQDVILYSDMPLAEMAKDEDFAKKWMFGTAMMLKKGLKMHFIHNVHRPFNEMMLGLESNIPMYMTGQIAPYYLTVPTDKVFTHIIKVSGAAAMEGSAIAGYQSEGEYHLTKSDDRIRFYRRKAERLLKKSSPLMDIYRSDRKKEYRDAMKQSWLGGDRMTVCASLPLFTLSEEALSGILARNKVSKAESDEIKHFHSEYYAMVTAFLQSNKLSVVLPDSSKEQFEASPIHLALSDIFCETDIPYTYEEYSAHLQATRDFAGKYPNLTVNTDPAPAFRNITYSVLQNEAVIVSKNKYPTIHFIIHHKKLVQAFSNFTPPLK